MKVLLYQGGRKLVGRSGVGHALEHQRRALESAGIRYTLDPKEDYDIAHLNTVFPDSLWMSLRARAAGKTTGIMAVKLLRMEPDSIIRP